MILRREPRPFLAPGDLAPSSPDLEVVGVFNPGAVAVEDGVRLLVRVAERPVPTDPGFVLLPRWEHGRVIVDQVPRAEVDEIDPRVVRLRREGRVRLTFTSHLRVIPSADGRTAGPEGAHLIPSSREEEYGLEDPRITRIDDRYWITYVCVSRHGAATALASTKDFTSFERHGVIFCPENKDVVIFPERIGGQYFAIHRPTAAHPFCRPEMWIARSTDLFHWGHHVPLAGGEAEWESDRVGSGAPPLRTERGWLVFYHASRTSLQPGRVGTYCGGAMLLDLENPRRVVARSRRPILRPESPFELEGFVPDVVFPTAVIETGDRLQVFFGAADTSIGVVEISRASLLASLTPVDDVSGR